MANEGLAPLTDDDDDIRRHHSTPPFDDDDDDVASMCGARGDARDGRCARVFERRARDVAIRDDDDDDGRDNGGG
jgi:hypothetical protein